MAEDNTIDIEGDFSLDSTTFSESSSILQNEFKPLWILDPDMSAEQRNEIERILLEDSNSSHRCSFLDSPSGRSCWSPEEEETLLRLLDEHGEKWTKIAKELNRSGLEVKVHAKKIISLSGRQTSRRNDIRGRKMVKRRNTSVALTFEEGPSVSRKGSELQNAGELVTIRKSADDEDEEIQVDDGDDPVQKRTAAPSGRPLSKSKIDIEKLVSVNTNAFRRMPCAAASASTSRTQVPNAELLLDPYRILPFEQEANPDYFNGKSAQKNPDRYLRIRNHILVQWRKQKPNYLNKTTSRIGLKNCGDVNCIGLIHDYLEKIGAINFGCEKPTNKEDKRGTIKSPPAPPNTRKRRKVNPSFVSQADIQIGGCTMEHDSVTGEVISKTLITKEAQGERSSNSRPAHPLKLVTCLRYDGGCQPFNVEVHASSLLVAQAHAHQSTSEVMGLLGGHHQEGHLRVIAALPTKAVASGQECDMDPVSQWEALETLRGWGLDVVGWYHSHPNFAPQPSMRDLTSQVDMQDMFTGAGAPFVALIISPYHRTDKMANRLSACMTCFVVEKHHITAEYCPFSLKPRIVRGEASVGPPLETVLELIRNLRESTGDLVELDERFNDEWTYKEKMLAMLQLCLMKARYNQAETATLLNRIHAMFPSK
ncbi:histone H2A deubiquitinase MYSM1 [Galendromus occidentalis]|uniref:Myb-like, SWIRM and MPN domain-containing protein 1 n=1 Tax=Galendromus occidentalis TaxID=34638 RepID=A0AAJ6QRD9_9ACAR|nr:histone H2A deubiquitinase MYSM1 [Galendromus occidentalis]